MADQAADPPANRKLGEYLLALVMYADMRTSFKENPQAAVGSAGLNEAKQKLLLDGNLQAILDELALEYGRHGGDHWPPWKAPTG